MTLRALTTVLLLSLSAHAAAAPLPHAGDERGRRLFMANCSRCHGDTAVGDGPDGALLRNRPADLRRSGVLDAYSRSVLVDRIRDGKNLRLEIRPGAIEKQADQAESIYRLLTRFPTTDWKKIDAGEQVYLDRCQPCHGRYGRPQPPLPAGLQRPPRDLSDPAFQNEISTGGIVDRVRHGKQGMPALVPQISERDGKSLAAFVRLLSPGYETYDRFCSTCHGPHGEGATGALLATPGLPHFAFDARYFGKRSSDEVRMAVWHMLEDKTPSMPHFADSLTVPEVDAILSYLRSLPPLPGESPGRDLQ